MIGPINLDMKQTGERSAGNRPAAFDVAGAGNVTMVAGLRAIAKAVESPPAPTGARASSRPYLRGRRRSDAPLLPDKESITVAYVIDMGEVELLGETGTTKTDIHRLCARLRSKAQDVRIVYEAGPCGYGLYRQLVQKGFDCMVCAPSLIPRKPGERVKTDRRDALKLTRALRAGDLSAVYVPGVQDEAFRDLARVWVTAKEDLKQARQRLKSFLLSHGVRYTGHADWGPAHRH